MAYTSLLSFNSISSPCTLFSCLYLSKNSVPCFSLIFRLYYLIYSIPRIISCFFISIRLNLACFICTLDILNINSLVFILIMPPLLLIGFLLITTSYYRSSFMSILIKYCYTILGDMKFPIALKSIIAYIL